MQQALVGSNAHSITAMKTLKYFALLNILVLVASRPIEDQVSESEESNENAKGVLDGLTSRAPSAGGLSGIASNMAGPLLVVGAFQAVVTKFDPTQGLPSLPSMPSLPGK